MASRFSFILLWPDCARLTNAGPKVAVPRASLMLSGSREQQSGCNPATYHHEEARGKYTTSGMEARTQVRLKDSSLHKLVCRVDWILAVRALRT